MHWQKKIKNEALARLSSCSLSDCNMVCMLVSCQNGLSLFYYLNFYVGKLSLERSSYHWL
jgi:hypothetical protein